MTFWFCYSCKRTWHSFVKTPDNVNKIRCFYCMDENSVKIKHHDHDAVTYEDYDKNLRKFKMLKNKELNGNKNHKKV